MELKDLIVPTKLSETVTDMIYLPSYRELTEKYHFTKKDLMVSWQDNVDFWWLRNDKIDKLTGSNQLYADGCVSNQSGTHYPMLINEMKEWDDNIFNYLYKLNIKTRNAYEPHKCQCNVRPCMRLNLETYEQMARLDSSYLPYKMDYPCLDLGKHFDIKHGKKIEQSIRWRILNWDSLPPSLNYKGNGTAKTIDLISLDTIGMSNFTFRLEDFYHYTTWEKSAIRRDLNGYGEQQLSFLDHAFAEEQALLQNIYTLTEAKKKAFTLDTNLIFLKKDFLRTLKTNPEALRDLIPDMKAFIQSMENC